MHTGKLEQYKRLIRFGFIGDIDILFHSYMG